MFPTSQPEGAALAHVEFDKTIGDIATWSIQALNAGPLRSSSEYDQHIRDTVGSSYDWSDEIRFDKRTGRLASFVLKTPEAGTVNPGIAKSWLAMPRHAGIPVLEDRKKGFHIDPLDLRYLADDGSALVVMDAKMPLPDSSSLRLSIGRGVDFLFHRGRYGGWILEHPVAHLVAEPGDKISGSDEPGLHSLLGEYLALVVEPNLARMSDEDPEMRQALQALRARVGELDGVQARSLLAAVERAFEVFYPE
jgi:hypothetical protein